MIGISIKSIKNNVQILVSTDVNDEHPEAASATVRQVITAAKEST